MQCQTVCKPGSVPACAVDGYSSGTFVAERLTRPTRATTRKHAFGPKSKCCPYSVLLPVWFALPPLLPIARCALTAPFHPYLIDNNILRRFAFCGTFRRLSPPRCYLASYPVEPGLSSATFKMENYCPIQNYSDCLVDSSWSLTHL